MDTDNTGPGRRTFFLTMVYGLWGVITTALSIPAAIYLLLPPKLRKEAQWAEAGDVTKMGPNSPVEMVFRRNRVDGWRIQSEKSTAWAVKLDSGQVIALAPTCTHLGCAYHWDDAKKQFLCPCHSSVFSIDGKVVSGPAPRPLDRYDAKVENNKLMVGEIRESPETAG
jgi:menaquinol-cytochrome c reductase iron-sulfur subunit